MASVSYQIANLLEKMQSNDKDFRFMATNDLMIELQKDSIKLDDDSERKVVKMLLRLLEDPNGEVQNLAVKCLGQLVNKIKEGQFEIMVDALCANMISDKEQLRDISSIGLKTVIAELPPANSGISINICRRITGKLITAVERQDDMSVQLEALDIVSDLLYRFGLVILQFHEPLLSALMPQLKSQRQAVRKRTIYCISNLVLSCDQNLYQHIVTYILEELESEEDMTQIRTYIQCVAAVCRLSGHKFGTYIEVFVSIIHRKVALDDDELKEYCLQAFESFVTRCPKEITPNIVEIIRACMTYIAYDPNYNYDDESTDSSDEDLERGNNKEVGAGEGGKGKTGAVLSGVSNMDEEGENDSDDDNDGSEGEVYTDDDDMSWKVRRAAAKCLEAIILTRREMLSDFYQIYGLAIVKRFKEREENVKSDIIRAYVSLLKQTKRTIGPVDPNSMEQETPLQLLQQQVPHIVRAILVEIRMKSQKTRQDCFMLLKELCYVLPGALNGHIAEMVTGALYSLFERNANNNMKIEALSFVYILVTTHAPENFYNHLPNLLTSILIAVNDTFYKITAEGLNVLQELVKVMRPLDSILHKEKENAFNFAPHVLDVYECTLSRLHTADIDQEVKERAISTMGQVICTFGDHLVDHMDVCLPLFLERLKNEITRLTAVKALSKIANSPLNIPLPILADAMPILGLFLRKNQRSLKLSTLQLLHSLVLNYRDQLCDSLLYCVTCELPPLLDDTDLHIAQWTLDILTAVARVHPTALQLQLPTHILPEVLKLVKSPLLQGSALNAMLEFFKSIVTIRMPGLTYPVILNLLVSQVTNVGVVQSPEFRHGSSGAPGSSIASGPFSAPGPSSIPEPNSAAGSTISTAHIIGPSSENILHKQAYYSLAKCVAAITVKSDGVYLQMVPRFGTEIQTSRNDAEKIFTLLVVGEIGREVNLSIFPNLHRVILAAFESGPEDVKSAASYSLGSICIGNLSYYLPIVLQKCDETPPLQYLLLHSLKEVITCLSSTPDGVTQLNPFVPAIWQQLFRHCESHEEGTRNVVAECLGKFTLINPQELLPRLQESLKLESPLMRTTIVTAIKFTISDQPCPIDPLLKQCIGQFLNTLGDQDLNVRRVALVAFNSAAHNKPSLIRDLLNTILPQLYNETKVKRDLIREVEMGPFKHTVDDGLDIRKTAFECMYTLLDNCLDRIDIFDFITHVESGLKDHYDIKMLTYLMVAKLAQLCPGAVLQSMNGLIEPLRATLSMKVKANSVKQEYEKQDELKRSALRAVNSLVNIQDSDKNPILNEFIGQIKTNPDLQAIFESIQKDSSNQEYTMDQS